MDRLTPDAGPLRMVCDINTTQCDNDHPVLIEADTRTIQSPVIDRHNSVHSKWSQLPITERIHSKHYIGGALSQMNLVGWSHELSYEDDVELHEFLYGGILNGFSILDKGAIIPENHCGNYRLVLAGDQYDCINNIITKEISEGKYVQVSERPFNVHALGAVLKTDTSYRPITDCKRPLYQSVNNFMQTTHQLFTFSTLDDVSNLITKDSYMASVDISSAYRSISIHPRDWKHQGISWDTGDGVKYYQDTRLCFGVKCAPYIFTQLSRFIVRCMFRRGFRRVMGYIDDFWVCEDDYKRCIEGQQSLIRLLGDLRFSVSWKKCISPTTEI